MTELLQRECAELAAAASAAPSRRRLKSLHYPPGTRLAVNVTLDFDAMLLRRLMNETPMQLAKGEFGGRVGIWRLIELFDSHRIKATIFTPGRICELYPQALRAAVRSGHELADHMWEHHVPKDRQLERDHLTKALDALERVAGQRPVGSRSWHSHDLMKAMGLIYNSHGSADTLPYYDTDATGGELLNLPFHYAIDDAMYYSFAWLGSSNPAQRLSDTDRVEELWWLAFEREYQKGGYLNICMHPFVSGRALRVAMLDRLFARMKRLPGVWFPTCADLARHAIAYGELR